MEQLTTLQAILLAGVAAEAGAIGLVWRALLRKVEHAEAACEEDRRALRDIVNRMRQMDRRTFVDTDAGKL